MTDQMSNADVNKFAEHRQVQRALATSQAEVLNLLRAKRWIIVGGGGFGREIYSWTFGQLHSNGEGIPIGFLDDRATCLDGFAPLNSLWLGRISDYVPQSGDRLLMAIADPSAKLDVGAMLTERGAIFASFIHPSAVIAHDTKIGAGCIVCPFVAVSSNVTIGDFVSINVSSVVGHDSTIDDGCTLSPNSNISGKVHLKRGVFTGSQMVILAKTQIGEFARIGAGSVVVGNVRPHSTMMGAPAKQIRWLKSQEKSDTKIG